jgi:formylmethanofuran dehydrogenase subunit E
MSRFEVVGTCDICEEDILEEDEFRLIDDRLYCPECFETASTESSISVEDDI